MKILSRSALLVVLCMGLSACSKDDNNNEKKPLDIQGYTTGKLEYDMLQSDLSDRDALCKMMWQEVQDHQGQKQMVYTEISSSLMKGNDVFECPIENLDWKKDCEKLGTGSGNTISMQDPETKDVMTLKFKIIGKGKFEIIQGTFNGKVVPLDMAFASPDDLKGFQVTEKELDALAEATEGCAQNPPQP